MKRQRLYQLCQRNNQKVVEVVLNAVVQTVGASTPATPGVRKGSSTRARSRTTVEEVYNSLGDVYFRRAYRMSYQSFLNLHNTIEEGIKLAYRSATTFRRRNQLAKKQENRLLRGNNKGSRQPPPPPNGPITTSVRLACALRYFAGGSAYDIMVVYGISHTEVFESVWYVVEAVNNCSEFTLEYPADHAAQRQIAAEFCYASTVDFDNCAGAIDGILIWIQKPTKSDSDRSGVGQKKFFL